MKFIFYISFFVLGIHGISQNATDYKRDSLSILNAVGFFKKCSDTYLKTPTYSIEYENRVYLSKEPKGKPIEKAKGYLVRKKNNYYKYDQDLHVLLEDKYEIIVNDSQKQIVIAKRQKKNISIMDFNYESFFYNIYKVKEISFREDKGYQICFISGSILKVDLVLDDEFYIKIMRIYYSQPMQTEDGALTPVILETEYKGFIKALPKGIKVFETDRFVDIKGKKVSGINEYKDYKILNYIE